MDCTTWLNIHQSGKDWKSVAQTEKPPGPVGVCLTGCQQALNPQPLRPLLSSIVRPGTASFHPI